MSVLLRFYFYGPDTLYIPFSGLDFTLAELGLRAELSWTNKGRLVYSSVLHWVWF